MDLAICTSLSLIFYFLVMCEAGRVVQGERWRILFLLLLVQNFVLLSEEFVSFLCLSANTKRLA